MIKLSGAGAGCGKLCAVLGVAAAKGRAYHTVTNGRTKLDDKPVPLVFIGYDGNTAAYLPRQTASGTPPGKCSMRRPVLDKNEGEKRLCPEGSYKAR
jgi:hypothetical protein